MTTNAANTTAAPTRSGADGAAGANRQWTLEDVNALPRTAAGGEQLQEAIDAGLLRNLGYGPSIGRR